MRKYFTAFIAFGFLAIIMTAICLVSFKPIESLMKPPMSGGDHHEIQVAFEEYIDEEYKLRVPLSGTYRSSYISEDLNGDGQEEIMVLYSTEDEVDIVKICFMRKDNNKWNVVTDLISDYNEVHQVQFADINGDNIMELLVGWTIYRNDFSRNLSVYKIPFENNSDFENIFSTSYLMFDTADIDSNGTNDIVVFESSGDSTVLSYNSYEDGAVAKKGSVPLDSSVYTVYGLNYDHGAEDNGLRMFIDAYKIDSGVVTECVFWDKRKKQFRKVESDGVSILSSRLTGVQCQDVNNDGLIEVPIEVPLEGSSVIAKSDSPAHTQNIIKWIQLGKNKSDVITYQLIYNNNDFRITFNEKWMENVTVINNYPDGSIKFFSKNNKTRKLLFELIYTSTQIEEDSLENKYKLLTQTSKGKLFFLIHNSDRELNINKIYLEKSIILNGG